MSEHRSDSAGRLSAQLMLSRSRWGVAAAIVAGAIGLVVAAIVAGGGALTWVCIAVLMLALGLLAWKQPALAVALWLVVAALVPPWIYPEVGGYRIAPLALASAAIIAGRVLTDRLRWTVLDSLVAGLAGVTLIAAFVFDTPLHVAAQVIGEWVLCYAAGRYVARVRGVTPMLGLLGAALGAGALAQMALGFSVADLPPFGATSGEEFWAALQYRAGLTRAELFAGHSIALGGVLSLCLPFAMRMRGRIAPWVASTLIIGGVLATVSRAALLAAVVMIALGFVTTDRLSTRQKLRWGIPAAAATGLAGVAYWLVLAGNSESELVDGTDYRYGLVDLFAKIRLFGVGSGAVQLEGSETFQWGRYVSIDNGFLYIGLYIGAAALAAYVALLAWVIWRSVRTGWTPAAIALVGQVPMTITVAPITQYQSVMWLITGIAGTALAAHGAASGDNAPAPTPQHAHHDD